MDVEVWPMTNTMLVYDNSSLRGANFPLLSANVHGWFVDDLGPRFISMHEVDMRHQATCNFLHCATLPASCYLQTRGV